MTSGTIAEMVRQMCPTFSESQLNLAIAIAKLFYEAGQIDGRKAVIEIENKVLANA